MMQLSTLQGSPAKLTFSAKNNFLGFIRRFINHKNKLSQCSKFYLQQNRLSSLSILNSTFQGWFKDSSTANLKDISKMVLSLKSHFENVMPCPKNPSFYSSESMLSYIIETAKTYGL